MIVQWAGSCYVLHADGQREHEIAKLFKRAPCGEIYVEPRYIESVVANLARHGVVAFERPNGEAVEFNRGRWIMLHWPDQAA